MSLDEQNVWLPNQAREKQENNRNSAKEEKFPEHGSGAGLRPAGCEQGPGLALALDPPRPPERCQDAYLPRAVTLETVFGLQERPWMAVNKTLFLFGANTEDTEAVSSE